MIKNALYFAYGSNILTSRIEERIGIVKKHSTHLLFGYKLVFNTGYDKRGLFANIIKGTSADFVEGVLYEIESYQLSLLDRYEGYYYKKFFTIFDEVVAVYINEDERSITEGKPSLNYLNLILKGCKEHSLTYTFDILTRYKKDNYKLRKFKIFS